MMAMANADTVFLITEAEQAAPLAKRLTMYRLRRKIEITVSPNLCAGHIWGEDHADFSLPDRRSLALLTNAMRPWAALFCSLGLITCQSRQRQSTGRHMRISLGVPEGAADLTPNRALMAGSRTSPSGVIDLKRVLCRPRR